MVDLIGIEPMTSSMPWKRAPSCATGPRAAGMQLSYCLCLAGIRQLRPRLVDRFALSNASAWSPEISTFNGKDISGPG